ncbi:MAG: hypothetical protein L6Q84_31640 [Polyangiaceae bacterium]|nr:hypothetical protein [Polyangiaceae bacterium]
MMGEAEAEKTARVGIAQAIATEEQVRAYGGPKLQVTQAVLGRFSEAIERAGVDVVPRVVVGGGTGGGAGSGGVLETLLSVLLSEKIGESPLLVEDERPRSPEVEALRHDLRRRLLAEKPASGHPAAE